MEPQEADETARLYVRSWQAGYKGLLPQYYLDLLSPERWKDSFAGLPGSFVLTEGGVIAGHSCARPAADEKMPGWARYIRCTSCRNTGAGDSARLCWIIRSGG